MFRLCSFYGCDRRANDGAFFPVKDSALCSIWIKRSKRANFTPTRFSYVCGAHFSPTDWTSGSKPKLKLGTVPAPANAKGYTPEAQAKEQKSLARSKRAKARRDEAQHQNADQQRCKRFCPEQEMDFDSPIPLGEIPVVCQSKAMSGQALPWEIELSTGIINEPPKERMESKLNPQEGIYNKIEVINWLAEGDSKDTRERWELLAKCQALENQVKELKESSTAAAVLETNLSKIYSKEQLDLLKKQNKSGGRAAVSAWSDSAILEGLEKKFIFGTSGYQHYYDCGHPTPAIKTIQERTKDFTLPPGVESGAITVLKNRMGHETSADKVMILMYDEMSLTMGRQYDKSLNCTTGESTLPLHTGPATKGMVWLVAGLRKRIKQPVAYHLTPNSVHGSAIRAVNEELIKLIESETGARIEACVSDMCGSNLHVWKHYGINATRVGEVKFDCTHPFDQNRRLALLPDVAHLLKNIKSSLTNNGEFTLSQELVKKHKLESNVISYKHILYAAEVERDDELKMAPKLAKAKLNPNTFQKMRVTNSVWVLNTTTAASLEFLASEKNEKGMLTTAWFCRKIDRWWQLLMSRGGVAFSHKNMEKFNEACQNLEEFMEIVRGIYVKGGWKPWQRGVLIATTGILSIAKKLIDSQEFDYVYGKRFSSNPIENLFSLIRARYPIPTAIEFKLALKSIILTQYAKTIRTSNYEEDLTETFAKDGFGRELDFLRADAKKKQTMQVVPLRTDWASTKPQDLSMKNKNVLYYVAGYLLDSIMGSYKTCEKCFEGVTVSAFDAPFTAYTKSRQFTEGLLLFISVSSFEWIIEVEKLYQAAAASLGSTLNSKSIIAMISGELTDKNPFGKCHDLKQKFLSRYVVFRIKIHCAHMTRAIQEKKSNPKAKGSATAGGHQFALGDS